MITLQAQPYLPTVPGNRKNERTQPLYWVSHSFCAVFGFDDMLLVCSRAFVKALHISKIA